MMTIPDGNMFIFTEALFISRMPAGVIVDESMIASVNVVTGELKAAVAVFFFIETIYPFIQMEL